MNRFVLAPVFAWVFLILPLSAFAADLDTRGGLVPDTPVVLASGAVKKVQDLRVGDALRVWGATGTWSSAAVTAVRRTHADSYYRLQTATAEVSAMGSHRVVLANGQTVRIDLVRVGDRVRLAGAQGLVEAEVTSVRVYPATLVAYDLTVAGHLPFIAQGVLVAD